MRIKCNEETRKESREYGNIQQGVSDIAGTEGLIFEILCNIRI